MRLFVAFPIPREVADACAKLGAALPERAVKRVRPELMHLTLAFIGEVPDETVARAKSAVEEAARELPPFDARLGRAGAFPSERSPRVVWVGLAPGEAPLREAARRVREALVRNRVAFDDAPPVAHITVARLRERVSAEVRDAVRDAFAAHAASVPALDFRVGEMHLLRSVLAPTGPTYTPLVRSPLGRPNSRFAPRGRGPCVG